MDKQMWIDLAIFALFSVPIYFIMVPRKKK